MDHQRDDAFSFMRKFVILTALSAQAYLHALNACGSFRGTCAVKTSVTSVKYTFYGTKKEEREVQPQQRTTKASEISVLDAVPLL